ncbi:MAG: GIY-YIG nuclease family protein [Candidatus Komeilibacteria bacterium]|nr:GIY-YIG nuclease family protein [Candidatus Komeilibacteria bacterium]
MWQAYILICSDDTLYSGITTDLKRRIGEHNNSPLGAKEEARIKKLSRKDKLHLINSYPGKPIKI